MQRKAFTLVELLIVISIIGMLAALLLGGNGIFRSNHVVVGTLERKYEISGDYRVEVKLENTQVIVLRNADETFQGKFNSAEIQANLTVGTLYEFQVLGERNAHFGTFPNIISYQSLGHAPQKGEIEY